MKRVFKAQSLVEVMASLAIFAIIALGIASTLRTVALDSAYSLSESTIERNLVSILAEIREDLRYASTATVNPQSGNTSTTISFQKVVDVDSNGDPVVSNDVITFSVDEEGQFLRTINSGTPEIFGQFGAVDGQQPLTISRSTNETIEFTVTLRGFDSQGKLLVRTRSARIELINP